MLSFGWLLHVARSIRVRMGGRGSPRRVTPLHRGVVDHVWSCRAASDAPCHAPCARRLSADRLSRCAEDRIPSVLVKARRSFGPKRLPSMNAPERQPLSRWPRDPIFLSFRSGARHRSRSFAAAIRLPTFLRPVMRSRATELDPFSRSVAHRLRRRMRPTSFIDFCNRIVPRARPRFVRAPLHRAYGRPSRSFFRTSLALTLSRRAMCVTGARVAACLVRRCAFARRRESPFHSNPPRRDDSNESKLDRSQPRVHGPGAEHGPLEDLPAPPAAIARRGSFTPTRSTRAPPVAHSMPAPWRRTRGRRNAPCPLAETNSSSPGDAAADATCRLIGPPLVLSREGGHDPLHPRCFPSKEELPEGAWPSSTTCPQGVDSGPTPLRSRSWPQPVTG